MVVVARLNKKYTQTHSGIDKTVAVRMFKRSKCSMSE